MASAVPGGHEGQVTYHEEPQLGSEDRKIGLTPHYKGKKGKPFKLWRHFRKKHHTFVCVLLDGQVLKVDEVWREVEQGEGGGISCDEQYPTDRTNNKLQVAPLHQSLQVRFTEPGKS